MIACRREHQRLAAFLIEFDGDEGILEIAQEGDQVAQAADARAIDRVDDRAGRIRIAVRELVREKRRRDDDEFFELGIRWIEGAGDQRALDEAQQRSMPALPSMLDIICQVAMENTSGP